MSGGVNNVDDAQPSIEVIAEDGSTCTMPDFDLPGREDHTQAGFGADWEGLLGLC